MNFRTTISLLVLLVAAAVVYYVTVVRRGDTDRVLKPDPAAERKVLPSVNTADVKRIVVTPATGDRLAFERVEGKPSDWRIVEPVRAPADTFKVDDLVREVTGLTSRGQVEPGDKGVDQPQYTVELTHGADAKTTTIKVGDRSPVGDMLYVRVGDEKQADVVSASVVDQLEKQAADYRKARLLDVTNDKINSLAIAQGAKTLRLQKSGDDKWRIVEPIEMPGDETQVSALLSAVTGLDAVKFVAEDAGGAAGYGLAKPSMTVTFTTEPPATQPSTGPATGPTTSAIAGNTTTIKFGRPDVQKQNVYAMVSERGPIVTVASTELEGLRKTPLDLRDREVLDLDANAISRVTLSIDRAATTQPTSQPAEKRELVLERRSEVTEVGPPAPATAPSTAPALAPAGDDDPPAEPKGGGAGKPDAVESEDVTDENAVAPDDAARPVPPGSPPADAPKNESAPPPQVRVTSPEGGAVVSLAAFQDPPAPADAKPEEPKPAAAQPAAPQAPPAAEPEVDPLQSVRDAVDAVNGNAPTDTQPTTGPTTQPAAATQPAAPKSKWLIASEPKGDANDSHVQSLIDALRPLRAQKYLEVFPTTQAAPAATYVLKVSTRPWGDEPAREHEIKITDPGGQAKPVAQVGDLVFEIDRTFLDKLTADFTEPNLPEPAGFPPGGGEDSGGLPPDLLRQLQQGQGGR